MNKKLVSKTIFYIVSAIMVFSIFFFFINVFKFKGEATTHPSFFDLMFGRIASKDAFSILSTKWKVSAGFLILFILQVLLIIAVIALVILSFTKKRKTVYLLFVCVSLLAATCGILALCSGNFTIKYVTFAGSSEISTTVLNRNTYTLGAGAYIYGITMIIATVGCFLPYTIKYCLK